MQKIDMGIAIVCMTNHTAVKLANEQTHLTTGYNNKTLYSNTTYASECPAQASSRKATKVLLSYYLIQKYNFPYLV
jgi:hypothetical protein